VAVSRDVGAEARRLAERGWPVFPVHAVDSDGRCTCGRSDCVKPGKHPRTVNGLLDATTNPATIERWWSRWPNANLGVVTGAASGLLVLDIDPRHGGDDALHELERAYDELPATVEAHTGGGGRRILFEHVAGLGNSRGGLPEGIDVRGDGGYFVAPPSVHESGRAYEWEADHAPGEVALAPLPPWLVELLTASPTATGAPDGADPRG